MCGFDDLRHHTERYLYTTPPDVLFSTFRPGKMCTIFAAVGTSSAHYVKTRGVLNERAACLFLEPKWLRIGSYGHIRPAPWQHARHGPGTPHACHRWRRLGFSRQLAHGRHHTSTILDRYNPTHYHNIKFRMALGLDLLAPQCGHGRQHEKLCIKETGLFVPVLFCPIEPIFS